MYTAHYTQFSAPSTQGLKAESLPTPLLGFLNLSEREAVLISGAESHSLEFPSRETITSPSLTVNSLLPYGSFEQRAHRELQEADECTAFYSLMGVSYNCVGRTQKAAGSAKALSSTESSNRSSVGRTQKAAERNFLLPYGSFAPSACGSGSW